MKKLFSLFALVLSLGILSSCEPTKNEFVYPTLDKVWGMYLADMMDPTADNYFMFIGTEGIDNVTMEGDGTFICLDIYTPLGSNGVLPEGEYTVYKEGDELSNFKFVAGELIGEGMGSGTFISVKEADDEDSTWTMLSDGKLVVKKINETEYELTADLMDAEGNEYRYQYKGEVAFATLF